MANSSERIVVLVDMDCFFCQVETRRQPEYKGKPLAVVQYMGSIIAVNYEARDFGVTRHMRAKEAKEKCPDLILVSVPCLRGKADTSRYRNAGKEVINVIKKHCNLVERASVDEAYLDVTDIVEAKLSVYASSEHLAEKLLTTYVVGYSEVGKNNEEERRNGIETWISNIYENMQDIEGQKLAIAGVIVEELRRDIFETTGFRCSAGIARNKSLAKLACGLHKPNQQTILPAAAIPSLYSTLPVKKVRNLGGKLGDIVIESLRCNVMNDLLQYSVESLQKRFDEKTGLWLYNIARGIDNEPVTPRLISKSIGACKRFPGKQAIVKLNVLKHWVSDLAEEVCERLEQDYEENQRRATLLTVCYHYYQNGTTVSQSRSYPLNSYKPEKMTNQCIDIITKATQCPIAFVGVSAGKFVQAKASGNFINFFKKEDVNGNQEMKETKLTKLNPVQSVSKMKEETIPAKSMNIDVNNQMSEDTSNREKIPLQESSNSVKNSMVSKRSDKEVLRKLSRAKTCKSSPLKKVNNLVKFCGKRDETNSETKSTETENSCSAQTVCINAFSCNASSKVLSHDNVKESFFMNTLGYTTTSVESTSKNQIAESSLFRNLENECLMEVDEEFDMEETDNNNCSIQETPNTSNSEKQDDRCINRSISPNCQVAEESHNDSTEEKCTVQLREIFPDLENIDMGVVSLLPPDLQKEATLYIKTHKANKTKHVEHPTKNLKTKGNKLKPISKIKRHASISSFLVKRNSDPNEPSKRCTQCSQMISLTKYDEHSDFHIAQALQNELNNTVSS